jgi:hypothetical protein
MGSNTQAKSKEVIVLLTKFIFISLTSFYLSFVVLAFFGFPPWEVSSGRSVKYSVGFVDSLRGKSEKFRTWIARMALVREREPQRDDFGCSAETDFLHP